MERPPHIHSDRLVLGCSIERPNRYRRSWSRGRRVMWMSILKKFGAALLGAAAVYGALIWID